MKIIKASTEIIAATSNLEEIIELAGRICYKSEDKIEPGSAATFVAKIKSMNHESVLEHGAITVKFVCDRGVSHELVRHRIASFSQESTRYCNYSKDKFGEEITVIEPCFWEEEFSIGRDSPIYWHWCRACKTAEDCYFALVHLGAKPQEARSVLPNSLKTEVVVTANPREWKHIFKLRAGTAAHSQMRELMVPLEKKFAAKWPAIFG
jgi:thymidylate synthase (FAD)